MTTPSTVDEFCQILEQEKQELDCLVLQNTSELPRLIKWLCGKVILLPLVIVTEDDQSSNKTALGLPTESSLDIAASEDSAPQKSSITTLPFLYHTAEVTISPAQIANIGKYIQQAIEQFIKLAPICWVKTDAFLLEEIQDLQTKDLLPHQQHLIEKLKERLGYLGVYYKRDPQNFFRYLSAHEKDKLLEQLRKDYRDIVLCYFGNNETLNQRIDDFVNTAFFADLSVAQIVEIHMDLMDVFSKQLKLEGRSEDILLDYRLTLIDVIAHLCEMYRRSIPREA